MTHVSASDARDNLQQLIDEAATSHAPLVITGDRNKAVLVSADDWDAIQETLYLLSVPGMRVDPRGSGHADRRVQPGTGLVSWRLVCTKQAHKDARRLASAGLHNKAEGLLAEDPFRRPPPFERLIGDSRKASSRRTNIQHRLVYEVVQSERVVKILRLWSHYE